MENKVRKLITIGTTYALTVFLVMLLIVEEQRRFEAGSLILVMTIAGMLFSLFFAILDSSQNIAERLNIKIVDLKADFSDDNAIDNVNKSALSIILENYLSYVVLVLVVTFGIFISLVYLALKYNVAHPLLFFINLSIPVLAYGIVKKGIQDAFMEQFAKTNNFKFSKSGKLNKDTASIFKVGHSGKVYNIIEGEFMGYSLYLFNYRYEMGRRVYKATVFSVNLKKNVPSLYLHQERGASDMPSGYRPSHFIEDREKIDLESTKFNKEFELYIKKGEHIPALQIFTPDVMAKLIDLPGRADIEFKGDKMHIYEDHTINTRKELYETFELVKYLVHNMDHVLKSFKYKEDSKNWDLISPINKKHGK